MNRLQEKLQVLNQVKVLRRNEMIFVEFGFVKLVLVILVQFKYYTCDQQQRVTRGTIDSSLYLLILRLMVNIM